jgi:hypothetical protein
VAQPPVPPLPVVPPCPAAAVPPPPEDPPVPLPAVPLEQPTEAQAVAQATIRSRRAIERPRYLRERIQGDYVVTAID